MTNLTGSTLLTTLAGYQYALAASGHRTNVIESSGRTVSYAYDAVYRLTSETVGGVVNSGSTTYGYDPVGNRLSRNSTFLPAQGFGYDSNDRLLSDVYDYNGNTRSASVRDPFTGIYQPVADQYDFENRLTERNGGQIRVVYDGDGNRVRKTITTSTNTVTTYYLVDDVNPTGYAQVMEELTTDTANPLLLTPQVTRTYTWGHALLSQDRLDGSMWTESYFGYDGQGSVRYLTDQHGNITDTYDFDAFGNLVGQTGDTPNNYLYHGEQFDQDLKLYYQRARYADPDRGRFWTQDSFEGFGEDPASLHKYTFCGNDGINSRDPSGNFSIAEMAHVGVIGGLTTAWVGAISRAAGAASAGAGWKGSLDAANEGAAEDFTSGFIGGVFGYGAGKGLFWMIQKAAPYLTQYTPTFVMAFNRASAQLEVNIPRQPLHARCQ